DRRPRGLLARGPDRPRGRRPRADPRAGHGSVLWPASRAMIWVSVVIQGVLLGAVYSLFACGLSLMFGVMRIINLAHGDIAVVGSFLVLVVVTSPGLSPFVALIAVVPVMLLVGYVVHLALIAPSLRGGQLVPLLTTFGLAIVIQNALQQLFSPDV